jgi:hypothetical protein
MAIAVIVVTGFLLTLWLVMSAVHRILPKTFRFKATLTRWVSLDLEMPSPEDMSRGHEHSPALDAGELPLINQQPDSPSDGRA